MGKVSISLMIAGAAVSLIGWLLFFRMAVELNRVLPAAKKIPLIEIRYRFSEIRRLYQDSFPQGKLSAAWLILMVAASSLLASAVITELARTSK